MDETQRESPQDCNPVPTENARSTTNIEKILILASGRETGLTAPEVHKLLPGRTLLLKIKWPESEPVTLVGIYAPTITTPEA